MPEEGGLWGFCGCFCCCSMTIEYNTHGIPIPIPIPIPMALHARTSVNVSSRQQLILSLPSPFACPSTGSLHISQAC